MLFILSVIIIVIVEVFFVVYITVQLSLCFAVVDKLSFIVIVLHDCGNSILQIFDCFVFIVKYVTVYVVALCIRIVNIDACYPPHCICVLSDQCCVFIAFVVVVVVVLHLNI